MAEAKETAAVSPAPAAPKTYSVRAMIRNRLLAGIATLIPIVVTIVIISYLSNLLLSLFQPVTDRLLGEALAEAKWARVLSFFLSLLLAFITIYVAGLLSANFATRRLIGFGERLLERIPVIKTIYGTMKQIVDTFSAQSVERLKKVAVIEYPYPNTYSIAFVTGETRFAGAPQVYVNVFMPMTPNFTSGFLMVLPVERVREVKMTVEEAFKFIISGGILEIGAMQVKPYSSSRQ